MKDPSEMKVDELKTELKKRRISIDSKDKKVDLYDRLVAILETEKVEKAEILDVNDVAENKQNDTAAKNDDEAGKE